MWRSAHPEKDVQLIEDTLEIQAALEALWVDELSVDRMIQHRQVAALVQRILDHLPVHYGKALEWKYLRRAELLRIGGSGRLIRGTVATHGH